MRLAHDQRGLHPCDTRVRPLTRHKNGRANAAHSFLAQQSLPHNGCIMDAPEQSASDLFGKLLDLPPEQWSGFLDKACVGTAALRSQVEALLQDYQRLGSFLAQPVLNPEHMPSLSETVAAGAPLSDTRKLGRYSLLAPLGAGGMGVVYRAHDDKLERTVAIKTLTPGLFTGDEARHRFHKEALALAKLSHAHIAAVYDVGEHEGHDYIVMECVPGESLAAKLKAGPLSIRDATTLLLHIAEALEEAHEQGVVHRDLKPANVMITPRGQAKVLDFGLAKLLSNETAGQSIMDTRGILGTPSYMSPEQAQGKPLDARTDLWSLGVIYYELLAGQPPFKADSLVAVLRAIIDEAPTPLAQLCPETPQLAQQIVIRALEKDPTRRYQSASEMVRDASELLAQISGKVPPAPAKPAYRAAALSAACVLLLVIAAGIWIYHWSSNRHWAREDAISQVDQLLADKKSIQAMRVLEKARQYLPADASLKQVADENTTTVSITSTPSGATVDMQDYATPEGPLLHLGATPLQNIRVPKGYFRWHVSKPGMSAMLVARDSGSDIEFSIGAAAAAPPGMAFVPAQQKWTDYISFLEWVGPYNLPRYYVDREEVTNRDYQKFVESGGYENKRYWPKTFQQNGHVLSWDQAMATFRDTSGRAGPSTWAGGHYPEGMADYPVSGVSWFEASAYAAFAGKSLPVLAQWLQIAPVNFTAATVQASNISTGALAPGGKYPGLGPYGTYDTAGNVREWIANTVDGDQRFILGGSWRSPTYLYMSPEALSPFDRSDANGFRCVRNIDPLQQKAADPIQRTLRDFATYKPVPDDVYHAYQLLYAYPPSPLNAKFGGIVKETVDWREEKISFDAAYRGERMSAYLFLPKNAKPPYQTVLFFPSARVFFLPPDSKDGLELGDTKFFDYILQSGRAVMYPIYEDTYERRVNFSLPSAAQRIELTIDDYKDAARSLDYLATRSDIDSNKLGYLGVSMGSADGVIVTALLQDRLKAIVFLDGGYFLDTPPAGADQADFGPRIKTPVLMVNGRYDFTFPVDKAQDPLFKMLGTPAADKRHVIMDTPHDVTEDRPQLVKEVLAWLDHYLGRIH